MPKIGDYLIDTHIFLWSLFAPENLPGSSKKMIEDRQNNVFVSAITFWEISLKYSIGKLKLENYLPHELPDIANDMNMEILPLHADVAATFHLLPRRQHKDPFDRMLVWQAINSNLTLITCDNAIKVYVEDGLKVLRDGGGEDVGCVWDVGCRTWDVGCRTFEGEIK